MVLLALPILLGLGFWQLQRAQWKDAILAQFAANAELPLLDLGAGPIPDDAQFRRVALLVTCPAGETAPRAGRNRAGQSGYVQIARCRSGSVPVLLDLGWGARPDTLRLAGETGSREGVLLREGDGWLLVGAAMPPLLPSAVPTPETIPANHRLYAVQWFGFAAILLLIYGLWVRRWLAARRLAP
jgi:cytochrome oxidase assembly protein ShyY1